MSQPLDVMLDVITEMTNAFGEPPSVSDVVEVVGLAIPVGDERLALSVVPSSLVVRPAGKGATARSSRVGHLDDAAFVLSSRLVSMVLADQAADGRVMTDSQLASALLGLLRLIPPGLLADSVSEVEAIELVGPRAYKRPQRGDVVAVPAASGGFHLAVILAKNRFGVALTLRTPWSGYLEAGLIHRDLDEAGEQGARVYEASERIDAAIDEARERHLEMLDALLVTLLGERTDLVFTEDDARAAGIEFLPEPNTTDYPLFDG